MKINYHYQDFFKNKDGRVVLWQPPNLLLYGWLACKLLTLVIEKSFIKTGFAQLSTALLFTWAYLELTKGANDFRRLLGFIVLVAIAVNYFRQ